MKNIHNHKILILDFGSQYTQLIARRIRQIGVYCELWAWDVDPELIKAFNPQGIILSGGPETVTLDATPRAPEVIFDLKIPILGICYGMQTLAEQLGGKVQSSVHREFGQAQIQIIHENSLLIELPKIIDVWMSHGDKVIDIPPGFSITAATQTCPIAAMSDDVRHYYGVQFHPEVTHTRHGLDMLKRFVLTICQCEANWVTGNIIDEMIQQCRNQIGAEKVLLALSGGVDSSVAALLLHRAVGDQLQCVFVDTGLLRLHEVEQVQQMFHQHFGIPLITIHAEAQFLNALKNISDPEENEK